MAAHSIRAVVVGFSLVAALCWTERGLAQSHAPETSQGTVAPLTADERVAVEKLALSDQRIRAIVGPGEPRVITADVEVDKAETEAYLAGTSEKPPARRVTVVLFNVQTNRAARALVSSTEGRVLSVERITASDVPFVRADADQALALAKANAAVRRAIGDTLDRFEILDTGSDASIPFAAQALPLRSTDPHDSCSTNRCLDLIFRTETGYLSVRAHVNLTKRTVTVQTGGQHR